MPRHHAAAAWALAAMIMTLPTAAAQTDTVSYAVAETSDLFPNEQRVDLFLTVTPHVDWRLDAGEVAPGWSLDRPVTPEGRELDIVADYSVRPACCPQQARESTRTVQFETEAGCHDAAFSDSGWTFTLTVCLAFRANPEATGPGSVAPASLAWDDNLDPLAVTVSAYSDAAGGSSVTVRLPTSLDGTIRGKVEGYGASWTSDDYAVASALGTPTPSRPFTVASAEEKREDAGPGIPGLGSLAVAACVLAVLVVFRRRASH